MVIQAYRSSALEKLQDVSSTLRPAAKALPLVEALLAKKRQTFMGFGGAFTEAACSVLSLMDEKTRTSVLEDYFSEKGLHYALGRVAIGSTDFSLASYDYLAPHSRSLASFSLAHDDRTIVPVLDQAMSIHGGPLTLVASPWSPLAFMKDNASLYHGGHLLKSSYSLWASYECRYLLEMRRRGIRISYLTVQNEPAASQVWESCLYTPEEEGEYALVLRKTLDDYGLSDVGILLWDHNLDILPDRIKGSYRVPGIDEAVSGVAFHWYGPEDYSHLASFHADHPQKKILFTEGCIEGLTHPLGKGSFLSAERYARNIIGDLNAYTEAWIDWNLVLDEKGGPNHVGNYCEALIQYDAISKKVVHNPSFYGVAQFARFLTPGSIILETKNSSELSVLSALSSDGKRLLIILNEKDDDVPSTFLVGEVSFSYVSPAHSVTSFVL